MATLSGVEPPPVLSTAPLPCRVVWRRSESSDVVSLGLEPLRGGRVRHSAGQFNMLYAFGVGEVPISVSGNPLEPGPIMHTVRDVGPVSHAICALEVGDTLGVRGPFGTDWGLEAAAGGDVVIVAGGIGLAPLRAVLTQVLTQRERFGLVQLVIGARTAEDLLYRDELETWRAGGLVDVHVTVDRATWGWPGTVGVVTRVLARLPIAPEATALVCGPEVMMRLTAVALLDRGLQPERIRLSMERNMQCAMGQCGHCQLAGFFVCMDGPVFSYERLAPLLTVREL